jgi:nucleoside-diphosphate-sugar epimerase
MNGLDGANVREVVVGARPDVIIHQMTSLAGASDLRHFDRGFEVSNRLRTTGLDYLIDAGERVGVSRFIVQSFCGWPYARRGAPIKSEEEPLDDTPAPEARRTLDAIRYQEERALAIKGATGIALRYGGFYDVGTGVFDPAFLSQVRQRIAPVVGGGTGWWSFIHLQDAATATADFVTKGRAGIYNVVDDDPSPVKVWLPELARIVGAKSPFNIPAWLVRLLVGEHAANMMTSIRAGSNAKIKAELGWSPQYGSWRDGFRAVCHLGGS